MSRIEKSPRSLQTVQNRDNLQNSELSLNFSKQSVVQPKVSENPTNKAESGGSGSSETTPHPPQISSIDSKLPEGLRKSLRQRASARVEMSKKVESVQRQSQTRVSRTSEKMKSLIADQIEKWVRQPCPICESLCPLSSLTCFTECQHRFCETCLLEYSKFAIDNYQEITCPDDECSEKINLKSSLFLALPEKMQAQYQKIHNFHQTVKNPSLKLCPTQNCDGVIDLSQPQSRDQGSIKCERCSQYRCKKCLLDVHSGTCESYQLNFFKESLKFRQCPSCKIVIQRNQGCNHMTCLCKYQFCYECGQQWKGNEHLCIPQGLTDERQRQENDQQRSNDTQRWKQTVLWGLSLPLRVISSLFLGIAILLWAIFLFLTGVVMYGAFVKTPIWICSVMCQICDYDYKRVKASGYSSRARKQSDGLAVVICCLLCAYPCLTFYGFYLAISELYEQWRDHCYKKAFIRLESAVVFVWET